MKVRYVEYNEGRMAERVFMWAHSMPALNQITFSDNNRFGYGNMAVAKIFTLYFLYL